MKKNLSSKTLEVLCSHSWPGNVRELENVIERALNFADNSGEIKVSHLPPYILYPKTYDEENGANQVSLSKALQATEYAQIKKALILTEYNAYRAAKLLGISKSTLYEKVKKYGLDTKWL